ncbi:hypothetical protein RvY_04645-2 [Ramazzottius varieornatus]|uniref:G-protein coupled receptors family 1 profile domain-containing protein n=1 Tax=Ramazzottius varieornatus TaxID=947166 RepID=A0A1D1V1H5_RAMVA|nr:hypothetical protein RvY_04645-2 [Ramazzottius varieornatus]
MGEFKLPSGNTTNRSFELDNLESIFRFHEKYRDLVIVYVVICLFICVFGAVSNSICLISIYLYPRLRHRGNILVGHLVLLNVVLCSTVYSLSSVSLLLRGLRWLYLPPNFCNWVEYYYFCIHCLVWHECFLAMNRFIAVMLPHHYNRIASKRAILLTIFLGYLVPFTLNVYASSTTVPTFSANPPFGGCLFNLHSNTIFQVIHGVLGVYIPMVVIGVAYSIVCIRVLVTKLYLKQKLTGSMKRRVIMAQMLFAAFLWFCLTYLPQPILTTFFKSIYLRYPISYFGVRWALAFGSSTSSVSVVASADSFQYDRDP